MIGERAKPLLKLLERLVTPGHRPGRQDGAAHLERVAELLPLDAKFVQILGTAGLAVGKVEKTPYDGRQATTHVAFEGRPPTAADAGDHLVEP